MESIRLRTLGPLMCILFLPSVGAYANPVGPTVQQGRATFTSQGPQLNIRTSDRAFINWQSFNIGVGETTTFLQPSSSSLVWNRINDSNPSQILGNLNANGYVVLQNSSGFYIGGQAAITTHGLLMTTAPIQVPDLSSGGPWQFNAPPPTAKIINYGHLDVGQGGSAFLISNEIENHGSISAPEGEIGLFAGKQVLLSQRPDGRGLSARVKLPQGSVSNDGQLIADAGTIAVHAQVVNQGGLVQANSVREVNGVIELVASDSLNLGPNSVIQAKGDSPGVSSGGKITLKSAGTFADSTSSTIDVSGGAQGGNGGEIEISASRMNNFHSSIDGHAQAGYSSGKLLLDPDQIILANYGDSSSGTVGPDDPPTDGALVLDVNSLNSLISQNLLSHISLEARSLIELQTQWTLPASQDPTASLSLTSGKSIVFDDGSYLSAGNNWSVTMSAGPSLPRGSTIPPSDALTLPDGNTYLDGIYLNGNSYLQTRNGNISLHAANEVMVNNGAIRTVQGGNIEVTADIGDVNCGVNVNGYIFGQNAAPYYRVNAANLGGISTAAGGNVTITAGRDVISYLPTQTDFNDNNSRFDGGTGAFGPQHGNVNIDAGRNVFGHFVLANGLGTITAGGDIGVPLLAAQSQGFALSLIKGNWNVLAPYGNIYVQDIRNPNGIFNDRNVPGYGGYHYFDYDPAASIFLQAADSVEITGAGAPHTMPSAPGTPIPLLFPPTLTVVAGGGGFALDSSVILFPSPSQNLSIFTQNHGDFIGRPDFTGVTPFLEMSDSAAHQWTGEGSFNLSEHATTPPELNNLFPVVITVSGNIQTVDLYTTKATEITVGGNVINSGFVGENLLGNDVTSINVVGQIYNSPAYAFVFLESPITSADPARPNAWDSVFSLAVDPNLSSFDVRNIPNLTSFINNHKLFPDLPSFVYDRNTGRLGFRGPMNSEILTKLSGPLTVLVVDSHGNPVINASGHLQTASYTFAATSKIQSLYDASQSIPKEPAPGFQIGGPGQFNITAGSMNLGNSLGILSWGIGHETRDYSMLAPYTDSGAAINVNIVGDLEMVTSTIASMYGGNVTVNSAGGQLNLGSQDLFADSRFAFGIYTSGHSDVRVTAEHDINIQGSRIAAYNGGNIFIESRDGDVNIGSGGNRYVLVPLVSLNPTTGLGDSARYPIYGSGIVTTSLPKNLQTPGGNPLPGDIMVVTPHGDITSTKAGILQLPLDGSIAGGPTVTLVAGTPGLDGFPAIPGNIHLGDGGLIGGSVNLYAEGDITGFIVSRQNSTIHAAQNFNGTLLSGGTANVAAGGTVSGTIVGVGGASVTGGSIDATILSQNASIGGGESQSTLGNSATATTTSQAASQQANSDAQQQVSPDKSKDDDMKKGAKKPTITRRVGRVTVIFPKSS
jgi:filamentous hemagglutinin family protein